MNKLKENKKIRILLYVLAAFFVAAVFLTGTASGDVVYLKNGDKITGDVVLKEGMINLKPDYAEKMLISFGKIEKVEIDRVRETEEVSAINDPLLKTALATPVKPEKYPNAGIVYLYRETTQNYNADRTLVEESRVIFKVLKERGLEDANYVYTYKKEGESVSISHARSISPEGVVSNVRRDAIKYTDKYISFPIYDKKKIIQFSVPEVKIGSIVDVKIISKSAASDILDPYNHSEYFMSYEPAMVEKFRLTHPKSLKVEYKKYFIAKDALDLKVDNEGDNTVISYEKKDIPDFVPEPVMPPLQYFAPHMRFAEKYSLKDIAAELKKRIVPAVKFDEKMKADLEKIIKDKKTKREKAVAIYEHLATNIRHAYVEASIDGYRPTASDVIYREKYASDYDRTVLLYAFMKEAGLSCDICFGYNENYAPFDRDFFTIYDFPNILLECEGEYLFAEGEYYPYGIVPQKYLDNKYFKVFEYSGEMINLTRQKNERTYVDKILDINIEASGKTSFVMRETGYGEEDPEIRASFKNAKPVKRKQAFEGIASGIAKGGTLSGYFLSDVENHSERANYKIEFESSNYVSKLGDMYMLVPIPYSGMSTRIVAKDKRNFDMFFDTYDLDSISVNIKIPEGYKVKYLPKAVEDNGEFYKVSMKLSHEAESNEIKYTRANEILKKLVPAKDFDKFKAQYEKAGLLRKERIILERSDVK